MNILLKLTEMFSRLYHQVLARRRIWYSHALQEYRWSRHEVSILGFKVLCTPRPSLFSYLWWRVTEGEAEQGPNIVFALASSIYVIKFWKVNWISQPRKFFDKRQHPSFHRFIMGLFCVVFCWYSSWAVPTTSTCMLSANASRPASSGSWTQFENWTQLGLNRLNGKWLND